MKIVTKNYEGVFYIDFIGDLTPESIVELRKNQKSFLEHDCKKVLLNLGDLTFISSFGVREILVLNTQKEKRRFQKQFSNI